MEVVRYWANKKKLGNLLNNYKTRINIDGESSWIRIPILLDSNPDIVGLGLGLKSHIRIRTRNMRESDSTLTLGLGQDSENCAAEVDNITYYKSLYYSDGRYNV